MNEGQPRGTSCASFRIDIKQWKWGITVDAAVLGVKRAFRRARLACCSLKSLKVGGTICNNAVEADTKVSDVREWVTRVDRIRLIFAGMSSRIKDGARDAGFGFQIKVRRTLRTS